MLIVGVVCCGLIAIAKLIDENLNFDEKPEVCSIYSIVGVSYDNISQAKKLN